MLCFLSRLFWPSAFAMAPGTRTMEKYTTYHVPDLSNGNNNSTYFIGWSHGLHELIHAKCFTVVIVNTSQSLRLSLYEDLDASLSVKSLKHSPFSFPSESPVFYLSYSPGDEPRNPVHFLLSFHLPLRALHQSSGCRNKVPQTGWY